VAEPEAPVEAVAEDAPKKRSRRKKAEVEEAAPVEGA